MCVCGCKVYAKRQHLFSKPLPTFSKPYQLSPNPPLFSPNPTNFLQPPPLFSKPYQHSPLTSPLHPPPCVALVETMQLAPHSYPRADHQCTCSSCPVPAQLAPYPSPFSVQHIHQSIFLPYAMQCECYLRWWWLLEAPPAARGGGVQAAWAQCRRGVESMEAAWRRRGGGVAAAWRQRCG